MPGTSLAPLHVAPKRRYLARFDPKRVPHMFTDVLIIGAGIAGARAALEIDLDSPEVRAFIALLKERGVTLDATLATFEPMFTQMQGEPNPAYRDVEQAQQKMTGVKPHAYRPQKTHAAVYAELYPLYKELHDAFGTSARPERLDQVMKRLIAIRNRVRKD